jgi:hypothetical protein
MLLPAKIETKDLVICPGKANHDQIFVVDWYKHFCSNSMSKYLEKIVLNSKNSLFLLEKMVNQIDKKTICKYSKMEIDIIIEEAL